MNIPTGEHWAIITSDSIYIEGNERSRTHPGHGYPAHTVESIHYRTFDNYNEFSLALERAKAGTIGIHVASTYAVVARTEIRKR